MAISLFRAFGTRVKVHWSLLVFLLVLVLQAGEQPLLGLQWAVILFASVLIHEFGHIAAARRVGVLAPEVWLTPLGGTAHLVGEFPSRASEALVALAGPATSALLFLSAAAASYAMRGEVFSWTPLGFFAWANGILAVFNSLPAYPMDGGVVLRAILSGRLGRPAADRATGVVGMAMAVGFIVMGVFRWASIWGWILMAIGISNLLACRRLLGAWRAYRPGPEREGFWARLETARERRRREKVRRIKKRVDELLDKVGRGGLPALSWRERKFLKKASEYYRERKGD